MTRSDARSPVDAEAMESASRGLGGYSMKQINVRWGDLGSPVEPGTYRCGAHMVEVTPGDIKLAKDNPDTVFTAIHPDFYPADTPYLLTGVELPTNAPLVLHPRDQKAPS
jgi:hypothetical protein